jgi:peptide/nickel transport system permease protein
MPADLSESMAKDWEEITRFGVVGFFLGNMVWIFGLGIIQLVLLIEALVRAVFLAIGRATTSAEGFIDYEAGVLANEVKFEEFVAGFTNIFDQSGLLIPLLVALAFFWWRYNYDTEGRRGVWMTTFRSMFRNRSAVSGFVMIGLLALIANFAMLIAPYDPTETLVGRPRTKPCINIEVIGASCDGDAYIFGTDLNGRDLFSRVIWGARISIPIGLIAVMISIFFGTIIGLIAGFYGGWVDNIIMRIMDVLLAFPGLLLAIAIVTVLGPGLQNALIAIAIVATPSYARLMRASVLTLKEQEFILAERALGASNRRIMFSQILPNALTPIVVQGTLGIGTAVLDAAALSFLGLGAQPPAAEWGQMLGESFNFFQTAPYLVFYPGVCIMITVLGFNLLGDGIRDALDPRLNKN